MAKVSRSKMRTIRQQRLRKRISGTADRPRLSVFRSNSHISAQLIDDVTGVTVASASSLEAAVKSAGATGNATAATSVGKLIGERAKGAGVTAAVFDRGGNQYHGRVAALADAAREQGLEF